MANYTSSKKVESREIEGVVFTIHRMTEGRRLDLRREMAPLQAEMNRIMRAINQEETSPIESQDSARLADLAFEFDQVVLEKINPLWVKWGLKRIEGLVIDDQQLGVDDFMSFPTPLFNEILLAVKEESELTSEARKNSSLPTTSGEREGGSQSNTIVAFAEEPASIKEETAPSTSQS